MVETSLTTKTRLPAQIERHLIKVRNYLQNFDILLSILIIKKLNQIYPDILENLQLKSCSHLEYHLNSDQLDISTSKIYEFKHLKMRRGLY